MCVFVFFFSKVKTEEGMYFVCFCVYYIKREKYSNRKTTHVFYVFLCFFSSGDFDWCMCFVCFCVLTKVKTKEGHVFCVFLCLLYKKRNIVTGKPPMCFMCFCVFFLQGIWVMHVFCVFLCFKKTKKLEKARVLCVFVFFVFKSKNWRGACILCVFVFLYKNREI